jgi:hypothetical protein
VSPRRFLTTLEEDATLTTLRTWSKMKGRPLRAVDGLCGRVDDVLFDDRDGVIRHIVVALGRWPLRRRVLLDPQWISSRSEKSKTLWAAMTREEIAHAPRLDTRDVLSQNGEQVVTLERREDHDHHGRGCRGRAR